MTERREFRLFISAASGELGSYRREVARVLRRKELEIRVQEDFRQGPATLLEQLADYIRNCDAVILLVGECAGAFPSHDHAEALGAIPTFEDYRRETGEVRASYTQWEFLLAKHHGKDTYVFFTGDGFAPDHANNEPPDCRSCQAAYRQWIEHKGKHYDVFVTAAKLVEDVLVLALSRSDSSPDAEAAAVERHREQMDAHRAHLAAMEALRLETAREKGVDPPNLVPLFEHLGQSGLSIDEMRARAGEAVVEIVARSQQSVKASYEGADIDAAIGAARDKLTRVDTAGALSVLADKIAEEIAEEEEARRQRLVPLLREKAAVERLAYDHDAARATLRQLVAVFPDSVWDWLELGDVGVTVGSLDDAADAFRCGLDAARRIGDERDLSVCYSRIGDVLEVQGNLTAALRSFRVSHEILDRLARHDHANAGWQRDLSVSYDRVGDVLVAQGNLPEALKSFRDGLAIAARLAQADAGNAGWQRDLSVSYDRVGDVLVAQGNLPEALKSFRDGLAIAARLAQADAGNAGWQRDLSVSFNKIGDVLVAQGNLPEALKSFRDGLAIAARLAQADAGNAGWQRDLSVSYDRVGDVLVAQGNLPEALKSFRASHDIFARLAQADAGNAGWQRDLSVSYDRVGDVLVAQGNLPEALKSFRDGLAIRERLAQADAGNAGWQRDLSVSYDRVGDVLVAQGNLPEALKSFRDGLAIAARLAQADAGNAGWQRDLSVSYDRVGDVLVAQGNLPEALKSFRDGLAIRERLAQADAGNAGWQRDLSVSYDRVGDVLVAQGNLPEALKSFRDGLAIAARLAQADAGNAGWQRDLSVSYDRVGDVLVAQGNLPEALKSFRDGLAIRERLAQADAGNAGWQRDVMVSCVKIADADPSQAETMLARAAAVANEMQAKGILAPVDAWMPGDLARRIAALPR